MQFRPKMLIPVIVLSAVSLAFYCMGRSDKKKKHNGGQYYAGTRLCFAAPRPDSGTPVRTVRLGGPPGPRNRNDGDQSTV